MTRPPVCGGACNCVALQSHCRTRSLNQSLYLLVLQREGGEGKIWLEANYCHFLLLSNWPSALPRGGPTAIWNQLRRMDGQDPTDCRLSQAQAADLQHGPSSF